MQFSSTHSSATLKMSKITIFIAVCCSLTGAALIDNDNKDVMYFSSRLKNVIKTKCMANAGESEYKNAIEALEAFQQNWVVRLPEEKLFGVTFYNYCIVEAQNFTSYLTAFIDSLLPCLTSEEEFLKVFLINGYGEYNQHLCKFMELLTVSESKKNYDKQCQELLDSNIDINPYYACYKDSKIFGDNATIGIITKQELCEDILDIRCCYDKIFEENCPNIPEYGALRKVFLIQSAAHCADVQDSSEENSSEKTKSSEHTEDKEKTDF
ncbi:hypothetical protein FQA39_LY00080 [Lamprigera yunnana]|nr:hypothetical protein FQA39_LY00080 [Lamprigera yunnana]